MPEAAGRPTTRAKEPVPAGLQAAPRLKIVSRADLTIQRRRNGRGFAYYDENDQRIIDRALLDRIRSLGVPPAYEDVQISTDHRAHLQAVGRDAAGRIQYRYHPDWSAVRETQKSARLAALCDALPRVRQAVARHLRPPGVERNRVMAAVVTLIDRTHIRIGCEDYVHSGRSRGAATLLKRNIKRNGEGLSLTFRGKGGRLIETSVKAEGLKRIYPILMKLPGPRLFQYRDPDGTIRRATASSVNAYLTEIAGTTVTAKDFRTLAATALAAKRLATLTPAETKKGQRAQIAEVMNEVAEQLCNTAAVVRKSYVHGRIIDAFESGKLPRMNRAAKLRGLSTQGEALVAALFPTRAPTNGQA